MKKIRVLLLGNFSDIFLKILKEVRSDFEIEKIDLENQNITLDYFYNFVYDHFQPSAILVHPDSYMQHPEFYDGLAREHFSKICIHMFGKTKMNIWQEYSQESLELMKNEIELVMIKLEKKEGENEKK